MIPDLAGLLRLQLPPGRRQGRLRRARRAFHVNEGVRGEPAALLEQRGCGSEEARGKRRIEKHDIEWLRSSAQPGKRVCARNLCTLHLPLCQHLTERTR